MLLTGGGTVTCRHPSEVLLPAATLTAVTHTVWPPGAAVTVIAKPGVGPVPIASTTSGRDTAVSAAPDGAPSKVVCTVSGNDRSSGSAAQPLTRTPVDPLATAESR